MSVGVGTGVLVGAGAGVSVGITKGKAAAPAPEVAAPAEGGTELGGNGGVAPLGAAGAPTPKMPGMSILPTTTTIIPTIMMAARDRSSLLN